jgi:hypothetical protein
MVVDDGQMRGRRHSCADAGLLFGFGDVVCFERFEIENTVAQLRGRKKAASFLHATIRLVDLNDGLAGN